MPFLPRKFVFLLLTPVLAGGNLSALQAQSPPEAPAQASRRDSDAPKAPLQKASKARFARIVDRQVPRLRSRRYHEREEATRALQALPPPASGLILDAYRKSVLPEVRKRLASTLDSEDIAYLLSRRDGSRLGYFGMSFGSVSIPQTEGPRLMVTVGEVLPESPAARGGLEPGDIILEMGELEVTSLPNTEAFAEKIASLAPGRKISLVVEREGLRKVLTITVGNRLTDAPEPWKSLWLREAQRRFWKDLEPARTG